MKKLLLALVLAASSLYAQQTPVVTNPTFYDDSYVHVPLQFGFPFYGRTFTNSWMHSNGVVSFLDPAVPVPNALYNPASWAFCCEGVVPTTTMPQFSYMIAPLWTDLYPVGNSTFRTEGTTTYQRYYWNNIAEISNMNNLNSFSLEIRPTGFIGANYTQINIQNQNVWVGTIGDPTLSQWNQIYYGRGIPTGALPNWSMDSTGVDICISNPLSSPACPGYTDAMCLTNPLYSTSCSGYATAYITQQCSSNPLFDPQCPGYATAYLNYQCSINPLYSTTCEGYASAYFNQQCSENPLYNSRCPGYDAAYLSQQCSINPLYSTSCTGYAQAYFNQQCSLNTLYDPQCPGYGQAYFNQQCTANPLYNTNCTGYSRAYHDQQCSLNQLYATDCPNYAQAYFSQQCSLNGLYNTSCPNYGAAYATKQALEASKVTPTATTTTVTPAVTTSTNTSTSTPVTVVADPIVNSVVTSTQPAAPAVQATATVPITQTAAPATVIPTPVATTSTSSSSSTASSSSPSSSDTKPAAPTARQEMQAKREAAAKAEAVEKGKNLANEMGKVADMESQKQVQNVVLQAMGFTPGFDAYSMAKVPDGVGYRPFTIYDKQVNVDNRRLGMGLYGPSDRIHNELVQSQYNKGN